MHAESRSESGPGRPGEARAGPDLADLADWADWADWDAWNDWAAWAAWAGTSALKVTELQPSCTTRLQLQGSGRTGHL